MTWCSVEIVKEERAGLGETELDDKQREGRAIKGVLDIVEAQVVVCMNFLKRFGADHPSGEIEALVALGGNWANRGVRTLWRKYR